MKLNSSIMYDGECNGAFPWGCNSTLTEFNHKLHTRIYILWGFYIYSDEREKKIDVHRKN